MSLVYYYLVHRHSLLHVLRRASGTVKRRMLRTFTLGMHSTNRTSFVSKQQSSAMMISLASSLTSKPALSFSHVPDRSSGGQGPCEIAESNQRIYARLVPCFFFTNVSASALDAPPRLREDAPVAPPRRTLDCTPSTDQLPGPARRHFPVDGCQCNTPSRPQWK